MRVLAVGTPYGSGEPIATGVLWENRLVGFAAAHDGRTLTTLHRLHRPDSIAHGIDQGDGIEVSAALRALAALPFAILDPLAHRLVLRLVRRKPGPGLRRHASTHRHRPGMLVQYRAIPLMQALMHG